MALTFNTEAYQQLKGNLNHLKSLLYSSHQGVSRAADCLLWRFDQQEARKTSPDTYKYDLMISYSHANKDLIDRISNQLFQDNFRIWLDSDETFGTNITTKINIIDQSQYILICISDEYKQNSYCRSEAYYAYACHYKIIPLILTPNFHPDGWLIDLIKGKIYVDFIKFNFDLAYHTLKNEINRDYLYPKIESIISTPRIESITSTPRIESITSTPRIESITSTPRIESKISTPRIESVISTPGIESITSTPRIESKISTPRIESKISTSRIESVISTPGIESITSTPKIESIISMPKIKNYSSDIEQWTKDDVRSFLMENQFNCLAPVVSDMNGGLLYDLYRMCNDNRESMFHTLKSEILILDKNIQPLTILIYLRFLREIQKFIIKNNEF